MQRKRVFFQNKFHGTKAAVHVGEDGIVSKETYKRIVKALCPCGGSPKCACGVFRECDFALEPAYVDGKIAYATLIEHNPSKALFK